jgi:hypothetical protein
MDKTENSPDGASESRKDPLPIGESSPTAQEKPSIDPGVITKRQENVDSRNRQGDSDNNQGKTREPLPVRVIEDDELSKFELATIRFGRYGIGIAVATFLVACVSGYFFYGQFQQAANQTDLLGIAARQARIEAKDNRISTKQQLEFAQQQTQAAQDAVKAVQRQMRQDQRAWIIPRLYNSDFIVGKRIVAYLDFRNTGKTPAKKATARYRMEILDYNEGPTFNYNEPPSRSGWYSQTILPTQEPLKLGVSDIQNVPGSNKTEPRILTQELADRFKNKKVWLAVEGKVTYEDIFGYKHWITTCDYRFDMANGDFVQDVTPGMKKCAKQNDTDNQ